MSGPYKVALNTVSPWAGSESKLTTRGSGHLRALLKCYHILMMLSSY